MTDPAAERRAALRRFAQANHPDRGGDPDTFAAGMDALRAGRAVPGHGDELRFHRRRGMLASLAGWMGRRTGGERRPPRVR